MDNTARFPIWKWSLVVVVFAGLFLPAPLCAMDFPRFDRMSEEARAEYVALMIDAAENALRAANQADLAAQVQELFTRILPGDDMPLGLVEYEINEARARLADLERLAKDPKAARVEVEHALYLTLDKNNMKLSVPVARAVFDRMRGFHPMTYAEFKARTTDEQRRLIALLHRLAYPDFRVRATVRRKFEGKAPIFSDDPERRKREVAVIAAQFPNGAAIQPGFTRLAREIDVAHMKGSRPDTVFYSLVLNVFDLMEDEYSREMKRLEDSTIHVPDRAAPGRPSAPAGAPRPAPTPKPVNPPAKKDNPGFGDAIGEGGFITPPTR